MGSLYNNIGNTMPLTFQNSFVSVKVGWEYTTDRGWKPFDQALSDKMEKAYHKKPSTIVLINNKRCV